MPFYPIHARKDHRIRKQIKSGRYKFAHRNADGGWTPYVHPTAGEAYNWQQAMTLLLMHEQAKHSAPDGPTESHAQQA